MKAISELYDTVDELHAKVQAQSVQIETLRDREKHQSGKSGGCYWPAMGNGSRFLGFPLAARLEVPIPNGNGMMNRFTRSNVS